MNNSRVARSFATRSQGKIPISPGEKFSSICNETKIMNILIRRIGRLVKLIAECDSFDRSWKIARFQLLRPSVGRIVH